MPAFDLRPDPGARYLVEIDHLVVGVFREAEGLSSERERLEIEEGGREELVRRMGPYMKGAFTLLDGEADDPELFRWMEKGRDGGALLSSRRSGSVILVDAAGQEVARWRFRMGVVTDWEGPQHAPEPGEPFRIERIEVVHEGLEMVLR
jgi:phage tail-like protein